MEQPFYERPLVRLLGVGLPTWSVELEACLLRKIKIANDGNKVVKKAEFTEMK